MNSTIMNNMKTSEQKLMAFSVWSLDVWGHSPSECKEHDCPCVDTAEAGDSDEGVPVHDENACQCSYEVNDRFRCGKVRGCKAVFCERETTPLPPAP